MTIARLKLEGLIFFSIFLQISVSQNGEIDLTQHIELIGDDEFISCSSWEYDTTFWEKTIIMDFDLVCEVNIRS